LIRRSPLKPGKPLKRGEPLKRGKPLAKRSKKMRDLYRKERVPLVKRLLAGWTACERCGKGAQVVHERRMRSQGGSITDIKNLVVLCHECHAWVHGHPRQATKEGWLSRRFL